MTIRHERDRRLIRWACFIAGCYLLTLMSAVFWHSHGMLKTRLLWRICGYVMAMALVVWALGEVRMVLVYWRDCAIRAKVEGGLSAGFDTHLPFATYALGRAIDCLACAVILLGLAMLSGDLDGFNLPFEFYLGGIGYLIIRGTLFPALRCFWFRCLAQVVVERQRQAMGETAPKELSPKFEEGRAFAAIEYVHDAYDNDSVSEKPVVEAHLALATIR